MKASWFSAAQRAFILKQVEEGVPIGVVCRKAGISQANVLQLAEEVRRPVAKLPTEVRTPG
jgi:hypothetical protein